MSPRNLLPKKKYGLSDQVRISHKSKGGGRCKEGTVVKILAFFTYVRDRNGTTYAVSHRFVNQIRQSKKRASSSSPAPPTPPVSAPEISAPLAPRPSPMPPVSLLSDAALLRDAADRIDRTARNNAAADKAAFAAIDTAGADNWFDAVDQTNLTLGSEVSPRGVRNEDLYHVCMKQKEQIDSLKYLIKEEVESIHIKFSLMMEKLDEVSSKIEEFIEGS